MTISHRLSLSLILLALLSCQGRKTQSTFESELQSISIVRGDIALCGSGEGQFGTVAFSLSCSEKARANFNLATALLHSFEYTEAEKVYAKVIDEDPKCVMAYWGVAMSNFHALWAAPSQDELQKCSRLIALARSLDNKSARESDYLETIATFYDQFEELDHQTRKVKFEKASQALHEKYPDDNEAAIFYALALRSTADPNDKSFPNQKKAGEILAGVLQSAPNHPGVAHYIIHNYDYPELADLALPAARKYSSIAAASAHAQHMPSHIFTRLGLWDESIQSNMNSIAAAKCYAQNMKLQGTWDEELHGMDYLVYAYLQKGMDDKALEQIEYLKSIHEVFPVNNKDAYTFGAMPTRFALERRAWEEAAVLQLQGNFPWDKYLWSRANVNFGRVLGLAHMKNAVAAKKELEQLQDIFKKLTEDGAGYQANLVQVQISAAAAWIKFAEGQKAEALKLMIEAAEREDSTEKDPVTPGEVLPARELLGDLYLELGEPAKALEAYEADLKRHPNRFNGLYGAGTAAAKSGHSKKASLYYKQLDEISPLGNTRRELVIAKSFLKADN